MSEQWGWRLAEGGKEASLVVADTLPGSPAHDLLLYVPTLVHCQRGVSRLPCMAYIAIVS